MSNSDDVEIACAEVANAQAEVVMPTTNMSEPKRQMAVTASYKMSDVKSLVEFHKVIDLDDVNVHDEDEEGFGGDYIKSFVFGGLDGIVSTFALVAGLGGAQVKLGTLIAVGIAKVLADAFSMGFGEFASATAELEHALLIKSREEWEMENYEEGEVKEMAKLYMDKGVAKQDALTMLSIMAKYKELFVEHMIVMEHGIMPPDDSDRWQPLKQGIVCFTAFVLFGMVPLIGFILVYIIDKDAANSDNGNGGVLAIAYGLTVVTLFSMGLTKAKLTGSPKVLRSGIMMVANGTIAGGIAYLIGEILTAAF
jgi:DNA damage-binding protein 1